MRFSKFVCLSSVCGVFLLFLFFAVITNSMQVGKQYKAFKEKYSLLPSIDTLYNISNEFNFAKALLKRGNVEDQHSVGLYLSYQDLTHFRDYYLDALQSSTYLSDDGNDWKKVKVRLPEIGEVRGKIKIHGTSPTPIKLSIDTFDRVKHKVRKSMLGEDAYSRNAIDITNGGFAFKLKLRDDNVYEGKSRFNFLAPRDDWSIVGNALNEVIASMGVITTYGDYFNLFVNGTDIGLYLGVEKIDKSLLERNFQITNYGILKNYDDWDKAWGVPHMAPTMYSYQDMEQSGDEKTQKIALFQLKRLFDAIDDSDYDTIRNLVDVKNIAKITALIILTGDVHPLRGDNARYVYDFSTGKFKLAYRIEGRPHKINHLSIDGEMKLAVNYPTHILIEKLTSTQWFRDLTFSSLQEISDDTDKILNLIDREFYKFQKVSAKSRSSQKSREFDYYEDLDAINSNLELIHQIVSGGLKFGISKVISQHSKDVSLGYSKVFMTLVQGKEKEKESTLAVLNDSLSGLILKSVKSCDGDEFRLDDNGYISPAIYNETDGLISKNMYKLKVPFSCIKSAVVYNPRDSSNLPSKDIYINYASEVPVINQGGLSQFGSNLDYLSDLGGEVETYRLNRGNYSLLQDVIFPQNSTVILEPGVQLKLSKGVSILIRGNFYAEGTPNLPIVVQRLNDDPFGSLAVIGASDNPSKVDIRDFQLSGGSEAVIDGAYFSSQLSIHMADVHLTNSIIANSFSDDGLNIKLSRVEIVGNTFENNSADQVDLDFVTGKVSGNAFNFTEDNKNKFTDGLDISGSIIDIYNNALTNMTDKGLSIGEKSRANIFNNVIEGNNIGIAIKDGSNVCLKNNNFIKNGNNTSIYIKKNMYSKPSLFTDMENEELKNSETASHCNIDTFLSYN